MDCLEIWTDMITRGWIILIRWSPDLPSSIMSTLTFLGFFFLDNHEIDCHDIFTWKKKRNGRPWSGIFSLRWPSWHQQGYFFQTWRHAAVSRAVLPMPSKVTFKGFRCCWKSVDRSSKPVIYAGGSICVLVSACYLWVNHRKYLNHATYVAWIQIIESSCAVLLLLCVNVKPH